MRDDRNSWPAAKGLSRQDLEGENVIARPVSIDRQTVLSGPYDTMMRFAGLSDAAVGSTDIARGGHYAIRQRRDRILVVGGDELGEGWSEQHGIAVTDMTAAYAVIDLDGPNAERVISTGTEYSLSHPSPSAARIWHGLSCLLYRYEKDDGFRLHVRSAQAEAAWDMLQRQFELTSKLSNPLVA